jgi:hypothetical protein
MEISSVAKLSNYITGRVEVLTAARGTIAMQFMLNTIVALIFAICAAIPYYISHERGVADNRDKHEQNIDPTGKDNRFQILKDTFPVRLFGGRMMSPVPECEYAPSKKTRPCSDGRCRGCDGLFIRDRSLDVVRRNWFCERMCDWGGRQTGGEVVAIAGAADTCRRGGVSSQGSSPGPLMHLN